MPVLVQIPSTEERSSMLKSFTVYIVKVEDFGRSYQIERRFDDFAKLHGELLPVDSDVPSLPEKKMWSSTDASTVAERRPAFEKLLRYCLRSESIVFDKDQALWKFLELPSPGVVAARYLYKTRQLTYISQIRKLMDSKYEKEHAYRLGHASVIKVNLHLLSTEGALDKVKAPAAAPAAAPEGDDPCTDASLGTSFPSSAGSPAAKDKPAAPGADEGGAPSSAASPSGESPAQEAENAVLDMLRWCLANGGESTRKTFLDERGLTIMLNLLFRKGQSGAAPDQRVRNVMNALVKAEGEKFPGVFAAFLAGGGVSVLGSARGLLQGSRGFGEFISKLLWIAWDEGTQRAFLTGGGSTSPALGLLGALFESPSSGARATAGLLLSCLLESRLLEEKEEQAAAGVNTIVEEMVACSPGWCSADGDGKTADKAEAELAAFVQSLGSTEERLARILACADAAWRLNGGTLPDEGSPLWACCAFALWCVLKIKPKPARIAQLRLALPAVVQVAPARARWLAGEVLLMLQLQLPKEVCSASAEGIEGIVEITFQERAALELALEQQVEHSRRKFAAGLDESSQVIAGQRGLADVRRQPLELLQAGGAWHRELDAILGRLGGSRDELSGALGAAEEKRESAQGVILGVMQMELAGSEDQHMERALSSMREVEAEYLAKSRELQQHEELLQEHDALVDQANKAMDQADRAVQEMRREISELEVKMNAKQREAQSTRTMASSDLSVRKGQLAAEADSVKVKQGRIRDRAQKLQAGELLDDKGVPLDATAKEQEMARMKAEAGQLKAKLAELQAEQAKWEVDPQTLEQQAEAAEQEVLRMGQERDGLRVQLGALEEEHGQARAVWQEQVSQLQARRGGKDAAERQCAGMRRQLEGQWSSWQPLWVQRLQTWRDRMHSLSKAQQGEQRLATAITQGWERLRNERDLRREVLQEVQRLQERLDALAGQLAAVDDGPLEALG